MKEDLNPTLHGSRFSAKQFDPLNDDQQEPGHDEKQIYETWSARFVEEFPTGAQDGLHTPTGINEFRNRLFYPHTRLNEDPDSLPSDSSKFDMPELIVCYKECLEINPHVLKDICVDEGPPNEEKTTRVIEFSPGESTEEEANNKPEVFAFDEVAKSPPDCTKGSTGDEVRKDKSSLGSCSVSDVIWEVETSCGETQESASDCSADRNTFVDMAPPIQEFGTRSFISSLDCRGMRAGQFRPNEVLGKDSMQSSTLSYNSKVESKSITFDFDPPLSEMGRVESLKVANGFADDLSFENGFVGVGLHVNRPMPEGSGSISFRSEGSATSGRSFAFPILQSEWNSSPIRMVEADGPHLRKHKFWRSSLLCCRF